METHVMDLGKGRARIDREVMNILGATEGDIIRLRAKRVTYTRCLPLLQAMEVSKSQAKTIIRIDGVTRDTLGIEIGDTVVVSKTASILAKSVVIKPLEPIPPISELYITDALEGQALSIGDNVVIPYFGDSRYTFRVLDVRSVDNDSIKDGAGVVTQETEFAFADEA